MATFALTDTADRLSGTAAADNFNALNGTLQTFDQLFGGGGFDTLFGQVSQNGVQSPTTESIERIFLQTGGLPFDLANVVGAEFIYAREQSLTLRSIGTDDLDTRFGASLVKSGTVKLQFEDGALSGDNDTLKLQADASNVTFTSDSVFDSTADGEANPTEDRLRVENINLYTTGTEANQIDISDFSAIRTLAMDGGAQAKVFLDAPTLQLFEGSATTGGVTLTNDIAGDQEFRGGSGNDDFKTGAGDDLIRLNAGDDVVDAGGGDNRVFGGAGNDEIDTEQGSDTISGGAGNDEISSGSGDDTVNGDAGNDTIVAGDGADMIMGGDGNDDIRAQGGADTIRDGAGDDIARGGSDNDVFFAGTGNDEFRGGGGVDTFKFLDTFGRDTVTDFTLTTSAATNDIVEFQAGGQQMLQSQADFQMFADMNPSRITVDQATDTVTINADGGTIVLNVSDADFLMA